MVWSSVYVCSSVPYSGYYLLSFIFAEAVVVILFMDLIFVHWQVLQKINPLLTVKSDLCSSHMSQMLTCTFDDGNCWDGDTSTKQYGRQLSQKNESTGEREALSRKLRLGSSQRRNGGQRVPRKISWMCSLFLRHGRNISCQVTWARMYSTDLPQGNTVATPCTDSTDVSIDSS